MASVNAITTDPITNTTVSGTSTAKTSTTQDFSSCLNSSLQTTTTLEDIFERASTTYQVPLNLLKAVGMTESGFKTDAVSPHGAQGVMQLMPYTSAELGVTNAFDPEQNIMGGAKLLSQLLTKYNGNVSFAAAAYNAGSNQVDAYQGVPPMADVQQYVAKVTGYMNSGVSVPTTSVTTNGASLLNTPSSSNDSALASAHVPCTSATVIPGGPVSSISDAAAKQISSDTSRLTSTLQKDDYLNYLAFYLENTTKTDDTDNEDEQHEETSKLPAAGDLSNISSINASHLTFGSSI